MDKCSIQITLGSDALSINSYENFELYENYRNQIKSHLRESGLNINQVWQCCIHRIYSESKPEDKFFQLSHISNQNANFDSDNLHEFLKSLMNSLPSTTRIGGFFQKDGQFYSIQMYQSSDNQLHAETKDCTEVEAYASLIHMKFK